MSNATMTAAASQDNATFAITPAWIMAGNATFTVHNSTGEHYTYNVVKCKATDESKPPVWFLMLLTGPDNESNYTYLGIVLPDGSIKLTRKSRMDGRSRPVCVAEWALRRLWDGKPLPAGYGIHGEGKCGRCGRTLTAPDGVDPKGYRFGFGPHCWEQVKGDFPAPISGGAPVAPQDDRLAASHYVPTPIVGSRGTDRPELAGGLDTSLVGHRETI